MSNKGNTLVSFLIIVLGCVLIWFFDRQSLLPMVTLVCGLCFVLPGFVGLISVFVGERSGAAMRVVQIAAYIGAVGLGAAIIFIPSVFRPLLIYLFGVMLLSGALFQIFQLSHRYRLVDYPGWLYVVPIINMIAGVVLLCVSSLHTAAAESGVVLTTGIACLLFGLNGLCISFEAWKRPKRTAAEVHIQLRKQAKEQARKAVEAQKKETAVEENEKRPISETSTESKEAPETEP